VWAEVWLPSGLFGAGGGNGSTRVGDPGRHGRAARAGLPSPDAGGRLTPLFEDAGLPAPQVFHECLAGGPESLMISWLIMSYQTLLPFIDRKGLQRADVGEMNSLRDRLVAVARAARTQFISNPEACGWVVRP